MNGLSSDDQPQPASGARPAGADGAGDPSSSERRDQAGDQRDEASEQRDQLGDRRDEVAAERDDAAGQRDAAAERRDRDGEHRDDAAQLRDELGGQADARPGAVTTADILERAVRSRQAAASDRTRAAQDRRAGAGERAMAQRDRGSASADRSAGATARSESEHDRETALADRGASAVERESSSLDALTGAYRRGAGFVELEREIVRSRRSHQPLVLAFVDVDGLKAANDLHGHARGDRMLCAVVDALRSRLRSHDLIVRYGGDEFLCAVSGLSVDDAIERLGWVNHTLAGLPERATVTVGLAQLRPGDSAAELVARADAALYEQRGRTGRAN